MNKLIAECQRKGLKYDIFEVNGCKEVKCQQPNDISECVKTVENNCIIIKCDDNYAFNSCDPNLCSNVRQQCSFYEREDGCKAMKCADGEEYLTCPKKVKCRQYALPNGCTVKTCPDGTKTKECPKQGRQTPLKPLQKKSTSSKSF